MVNFNPSKIGVLRETQRIRAINKIDAAMEALTFARRRITELKPDQGGDTGARDFMTRAQTNILEAMAEDAIASAFHLFVIEGKG